MTALPSERSWRVFVVEDEMLLALMIEDMLADLGHQVVALATRLEPAVALARTVEADVAILDINLAGARSFPIADVLQSRGIPFVFATGYGSLGLNEAHAGALTVKKPFEAKDLSAAIGAVLG